MGTVEHKYTTLDGKVVREETSNSITVDYFYNNEGKPYKLKVYEIQDKIRHILQTAQKKAKGENHSQQAKR